MNAFSEHYPTADEVDAWCAGILERAEKADLEVTFLEDEVWPFRLGVRHTGGVFLSMKSNELGDFTCFWQTCPSGRGPVLLHTPGYGAELSAHPELVADGYNVLHVNPLGYGTPNGRDESKRRDDNWPVWADTIASLGREGYVEWFAQAAASTLWALGQEEVENDRLAFFGTSQGGRGSIVLGSMFRDRGVRAVAADVPGWTNQPRAWERLADLKGLDLPQSVEKVADRSADSVVVSALHKIARQRPDDLPAAVKALGCIDPISHARRMTMPVLLTAGAEDTVCPPERIFSLFEMLPGTRSYTEIAGQGHAYTTPFLHLARAWFRLYV